MRRRSILIVNDDPVSCKLFKAYATRAGYEALAVESAEQALAHMATVHPDLIVLDMKLPGMDGMALLRLLKADPTTRDISILVTTVNDQHYNQQLLMEAGADGYLVVPAEREQLMEVIKSMMAAALKKRAHVHS